MKYYVYVYMNPMKPSTISVGGFIFSFEPFYVGFGHGDRLYSHLNEAQNNKSHSPNKLKFNKIRKILKAGELPIIKKIKTFDNADNAKELEISLIKAIGRRDLKKGPLVNMTDGGEGTLNRIYSEEALDKFRVGPKVLQIDDYGNVLKIWKSAGSVMTSTGINSSHIHARCKNKNFIKAGKFYWRYENEFDKSMFPIEKLPILQYTLDGKFIRLFRNSKEVSSYGYHSTHVLKCARNTKKYNKNGFMFAGFMWKFHEENSKIEKTIANYKRISANVSKESRKILQKDKKSNKTITEGFVFEFRTRGFKTKTILMCCRGILNSSQGFKWQYKD